MPKYIAEIEYIKKYHVEMEAESLAEATERFNSQPLALVQHEEEFGENVGEDACVNWVEKK